MHPYATDSNERRHIVCVLAFLALFVAWLIVPVFRCIGLDHLWWLSAPSAFSVFGLLYYGFDRRVWKQALLRRFSIVRVPDLNGHWEGELRSSFNNHSEPIRAVMQIRQTWTRVAFELTTATSQSNSTIAAVLTEGMRPVVVFEYMNEPKADAISKLATHRGLTRFTVVEGVSTRLEGDYYTGRGRQTIGTLTMQRSEQNSIAVGP